MSVIVFLLFGDLIGSRFGLVKDNGSSCESVLHGQLIIWVDMDNNPIVGEIRNRGMSQHPFPIEELGKGRNTMKTNEQGDQLP